MKRFIFLAIFIGLLCCCATQIEFVIDKQQDALQDTSEGETQQPIDQQSPKQDETEETQQNPEENQLTEQEDDEKQSESFKQETQYPLEGTESVVSNESDNHQTSEIESNEDQGCELVYVIDVAYQSEIGHYETIVHPPITEIQIEESKYVQYIFYSEDGSSWEYIDEDFSFDGNQYLMDHIEQYERFTYGIRTRQIEKEVVVKEGYEELIWIVDQQEIQQQGHYEEVCE